MVQLFCARKEYYAEPIPCQSERERVRAVMHVQMAFSAS
jgi:hypothetical protein